MRAPAGPVAHRVASATTVSAAPAWKEGSSSRPMSRNEIATKCLATNSRMAVSSNATAVRAQATAMSPWGAARTSAGARTTRSSVPSLARMSGRPIAL